MASAQEQHSTNNAMNNDKPDMVGDDSHLVDEILNELNDTNTGDTNPPNVSQGHNLQQEQPQSSENTTYNPNQFAELEQQTEQEHRQVDELPPTVNIEYDSNENITSTIMNKMKKPLIVLLLCFIVFNPKIKEKLINLVPIFNTSNQLHLQLQTLVLSIAVSGIFFTTTLLC